MGFKAGDDVGEMEEHAAEHDSAPRFVRAAELREHLHALSDEPIVYFGSVFFSM